MSKSATLTAIDLEMEKDHLRRLRTNISVGSRVLSEDDLEQPITEPPAAPQPAPEVPEGVYYPIQVYQDDLREYYPRRPSRDGQIRVGTRLIYRNGAARPVKETFEEVKRLFAARDH